MKSTVLARIFVPVLLVTLLGSAVFASTDSPVYISEVAWSGTQANWADEWLELSNSSDKVIDLKGWTLSWEGVTVHLGKEKGSTLTLKNKKIKPGEAFLLERSDDDSVASVKADLIYEGSLANSGEELLLKNSRGEEVQVVGGDEGWVAGTTSSGEPGYASMELIDGQWKTHEKKGEQKDTEENLIYGSPGSLPEETE